MPTLSESEKYITINNGELYALFFIVYLPSEIV